MLEKILVVEPDKCVACRNCELACSFKHGGEFNPMRSRIRSFNYPVTPFPISITCLQCEDAVCEGICPTWAIFRDLATGAIVIDKERCEGCEMCMQVCPFGNIRLDPLEDVAIKCDLCGGDPECVKFCITGALQYVEAKDSVRFWWRDFVEKVQTNKENLLVAKERL
nr:4Fe-4S dicluster domain-containing protein [Desulfobacterales bacterium]